MSAVDGFVAEGFDGVRATFEQIVASGDLGDGGAAYAIYHEGALIVDLWAGSAGDGPWQQDTRNTWMSVSKAATALCMQMLYDRGQLDLDATVASYWPEFAAAGKAEITVRQVLTHSCGVLGSAELTSLVNLDNGEGIDDMPAILRAIEGAAPAWKPGSQFGYHTFTYSWILGEVLRRIDGRSLGAFFREEVAVPLDCIDARIGTPAEHHGGIAKLHHLMYPAAAPELVVTYMETVLAAARVPDSPAGLSMLGRGEYGALDRLPEVFNNSPGLTAELGGSNLCATARSVARIFAAIVEPEGLDGVKLASRESFDVFSELQTTDRDVVLLIQVPRAVGYGRNIGLEGRPQACGPNEETIVHGGVGGQLGFADPVARVAGAYTRSHHTGFPAAYLLLNNAVYASL